MDECKQELRDFLLRATHDLRTALRAVRINAELLLKSPEKRESPEFEQLLGFLVNGAAGADALVTGLSNYATALQISPNTLPISMRVLVNSAVAKLAAEIRASGAEIAYGELPRVAGDPDRLLQLMENLLRNALVHRGEEAPRIEISAAQQGDEWVFTVADNGPGIAAEDLARIFRPFERLRRDRGVGLGLAVCQQIVDAHGGRIWAESGKPNGAIFHFTLPQADAR